MDFYKKDFDERNNEKKKLEKRKNQRIFYPKQRQLRYIKL